VEPYAHKQFFERNGGDKSGGDWNFIFHRAKIGNIFETSKSFLALAAPLF